MSNIPNFNADPEMEQLLQEEPTELDEQALIDVQLYKSKKLQARRDAGESRSEPGWDPIQPGDFVGGGVQSNGDAPPSDGKHTGPEEDAGENESAEEPENSEDDTGPSEVPETGEPARAELEAEDQLDYYTNLKEDYRIVAGGSEPTSSTNEAEGDPAESTTDSPSVNGQQAVSTNGSKAPANEGSDRLTLEGDRLLDQIDRYHQQTLELKDEIADLREENARLRERADATVT